MATLRTYSKKTPRVAAPFAVPVDTKSVEWDELDAIISEGDSGIKSKGKRKEEFSGKENAVNQSCNSEERPTKKVCNHIHTRKKTLVFTCKKGCNSHKEHVHKACHTN